MGSRHPSFAISGSGSRVCWTVLVYGQTPRPQTVFLVSLCGRQVKYYPLFIDEKTESRRSTGTHPLSHGCGMVESGPESGSLGSKSQTKTFSNQSLEIDEVFTIRLH